MEHSLSDNSLRMLEDYVLARDVNRKLIETPEQMFRRVAENIAQADRQYDSSADLSATEEEFFRLLSELRFLPALTTLLNAGRLQQLFPCYLLPIQDSREGVSEAIEQTGLILRTGAKIGFFFSAIRAKKGAFPGNGETGPGPTDFMKLLDHAIGAISQRKMWRGSNNITLRVDHPGIADFLEAKRQMPEISNINICVAITRGFMEAYERGEDYDLVAPASGRRVGRLSARMMIEKIADQAFETGEPALYFIDRANEANPISHLGPCEGTDPCAGQPLLRYEGCNIGNINLEKHLRGTPGRFELDWNLMERSIRSAVHFLDNAFEMNRYPTPETERSTKVTRKIVLSVMGFARTLFKLAIPYASDRGIEMAGSVMGFIQEVSHDESSRLAEKRGVYPAWEMSLHEKRGQRIRHACITGVNSSCPLSIIADTSAGCEPDYSMITNNVKGEVRLAGLHDCFVETAKREGFWSEGLLHAILENRGSVYGLPEIPPKWQEIFVSAYYIPPQWHVRIQAAFQEFCDSAVLKTIYLPPSATVNDLIDSYVLAYRLKCKGITV